MTSLSSHLTNRFTSLTGWRRVWVTILLGALAGLAFPPFNLVPLLWVSFPALYLILERAQNVRQAFALGWSFSFGLLVVCFHWIAGALFVDIGSFWWALPFAIAGLPAVMALYYGLASMAAWKWGLNRVSGPFFFAFSWFVAEMARGHLFTGFPWDILGYVWGACLPVLQSVSVIGIEGLTLVTFWLALLPVSFFVLKKRRHAASVFLAGLVMLAFVAGAGGWRLSHASSDIVPDVRLRLVQPHIDQAMKWKPEKRVQNFMDLMQLSFAQPGAKPITHYIWPETATSYRLAETTEARQRIAEKMGPKATLITGVVRAEMQEDGTEHFYNSIIAIDGKGTVTAGYDKHHLVPFGEFMPVRSLLPIPAIASMGSDFSAGPGPRTIRVAHLPPFGALVCYEAIFPEEAIEKEDPPQLLINVTNDAWYEGTIGPAQHFAIARVRAIEQGLPLVRVANKGVTAVVDPYGRVTSDAVQERPSFIDADLPKSLCTATVMARWSTEILWLIAGIQSFLLLIGLFFRKKFDSL